MKARLVLLSILALAASCTGGGKSEFDALYEGLPFDMPRVQLPSIPAREAVLTDFGGVGDGVTLNTQAFADAIASLERQGGGRVVVPAVGPFIHFRGEHREQNRRNQQYRRQRSRDRNKDLHERNRLPFGVLQFISPLLNVFVKPGYNVIQFFSFHS